MRIVVPILLVLVLLIVLAVLTAIFSDKKTAQIIVTEHVLTMIQSCNDSDKMLDIYKLLDKSAAEHKISIQHEFREYFQ